MIGTIVTTKGICIVKRQGERLFLPYDKAKDFKIGDSIKFDNVIESKPMREIGTVLSVINENNFKDKQLVDNSKDEITNLLNKYLLIPNRPRDLTRLNTFSIDPKGSRDLDDAISSSNNRIYVHIPFFELSAELDKEAYEQQYSIYFPKGSCSRGSNSKGSCFEEVYHLLPLNLSSKKYSLIENKLRLTWTVEFDLNMNFIDVYQAFIVNKHQLAYEDAKDSDFLKLAYEIYRKNKKVSNENTKNKIKSHVPSYDYILKNGKLLEIKEKSHFESHSMIEFYMIRCNIAIATYLLSKNILFPRRAHDSPKKSPNQNCNLSVFSPEVQSYLEIISSFSAYYTTNNKSHHNLQIDNYTHFTSSIRRYIDQIISRLLLGEKITKEQLDDICTKANIQEKKIDAMNEEFLSQKINEYLVDYPIHEGIITYVSSWGIHVLMIPLRLTAHIHVSKLSTGERLLFQDNCLTGNRIFKLGDTIKLYAHFQPDLTWYYVS